MKDINKNNVLTFGTDVISPSSRTKDILYGS